MAPRRHALPGLALAALVAGCNAPEPPEPTGGTNQEPGACGRGVVVVSTDYQSTDVSLLGLDGTVLSASFISSAGDATLSAKLSGDVVVPTSRSTGSDVVVIQRRPVGVLTWVDVKTGAVRGQLSLGTTNPHDYLELASNKAYVTRYYRDPNGVGSDVAVVDPEKREVVGQIGLAPAMTGVDPSVLPTPWHLYALGDRVLVSLTAESAGATDVAPSRLASIDPKTDSLGDVLVFDGLYECFGFAPSPDGKRVALSCTGRFHSTSDPDPKESGIVIVDVESGLKEIRRIPAQNGAPYGFAVAWASPHALFANTLGANSPDGLTVVRKDSLVEIDVDTQASRVVLESQSKPFVLGDVRCAAACKVCFATDLERGVVHRFDVGDDGQLGTEKQPIVADPSIGLPPYLLGGF